MAVANEDEAGLPPGYIVTRVQDGYKWVQDDGPRGGTIFASDASLAREHARRDAWLDYHKRNGDMEMGKHPGVPPAPKHYTDGGIETIDYIRAKMKPGAFACYCRGNVLKYASRAGKKGPAIEDVRKLEDYARWWREALEGE